MEKNQQENTPQSYGQAPGQGYPQNYGRAPQQGYPQNYQQVPPQGYRQAPPQNSKQAPAQDRQKATEQNVQNAQTEEVPKKHAKLYFYIAIACTVLGAVFFGLTFTVLKVYALLASIVFCLASLSLLGAQKKRQNFTGVKILLIVTYVLFGLFVALLLGGVIWSMVP